MTAMPVSLIRDDVLVGNSDRIRAANQTNHDHAILFDLDGTLTDPKEGIIAACSTLAQLAWPLPPTDAGAVYRPAATGDLCPVAGH